MKIRVTVASLIVLLAFLVAACGGSAPDALDKPEDSMMPDETAEPTEEPGMESPAWFSISLKDVRTGEAFAMNDFKGQVILVETMAVWCPTCYKQQEQIKALHELLGMREDFVSVSLDIDPNEDETVLAGYLQQNSEFDWRYAIAGSDLSREIGNTYGDQFLNPPAAPVLVIDRHGVAHPLPFGLKNAEELQELIQPYLDESI